MVQITGTLTIKTVTGRYGDFNVATLDCELGRFAIRDALLDEYNEGTYQGTFGLQRIFAGSYHTQHRFVIETRAELNGVWLNDYQEGQVPEESLEADPLAEERQAQSAGQAHRHAQDASHEDASELFGELWPLGANIGDIVKLNPEVGRERMGRQLAYLKREVNGARLWRFEPKAQHWLRIGLDEEA
ncbi:DUF3275 family protein [Vibrio jasicida]|uniref:DUF3275 family protein n=1 Tax=Vibrio jasicida TaxID=766224 RepID=UPI0005EFD333|nr:DUF3275 family protein [Vibrio jasicida]